MSEPKLSDTMRTRQIADEWIEEVAALEAKLEAIEYALSQEANGTLCRCRYETNMMGQVPEGSFCHFCGYRRYESVITGKWQAAAQEEE